MKRISSNNVLKCLSKRRTHATSADHKDVSLMAWILFDYKPGCRMRVTDFLHSAPLNDLVLKIFEIWKRLMHCRQRRSYMF